MAPGPARSSERVIRWAIDRGRAGVHRLQHTLRDSSRPLAQPEDERSVVARVHLDDLRSGVDPGPVVDQAAEATGKGRGEDGVAYARHCVSRFDVVADAQ